MGAFAAGGVSVIPGKSLQERLKPAHPVFGAALQESVALYLLVFGALLLVAALLDDVASRVRVPGILMVLVLGLLVENNLNEAGGASGTLLSLDHANQIAQCALILVLFFGGLTTNWSRVRNVIAPAARLATLGVLFTAVLITLVMLGLGVANGEMHWSLLLPGSLFVGAMVSSTDASAVMALLRPLAGRLPEPLLDLIETESSINDPMAVVLAQLALALIGGEGMEPSMLVAAVARQFLLGILLGFLGGSVISQLSIGRNSLTRGSMLPVVSLALLLVLTGATTLMGGSPLLAAYLAGLVLGNSPATDQKILEESHASFAKMAELLLFLCMGLVVAPQDVVRASWYAFLLFLVMQLVRWLMVNALLLRTSFSQSERTFVCWTGIRGAVPIAMAIQAWAANVSFGAEMPPLALGVVLLGLLSQGLLLVPLAKKLGIASPVEPPPSVSSGS